VKREQNGQVAGNIINIVRWAPIIAQCVETRFSEVMGNSTAVADGQVFLNL
jgi:hypothetical protein